jgi:DNA-binding transcriptional ArsR family regulator
MHTTDFQARARVLKAMANPDRLRIVDLLSRGEKCLCELQPRFTIGKSTLSRHVDALRRVGIVTERREGTRAFLKLATPCILNALDCAMKVVRADHHRRARSFDGGAP